MRIGRMGLMGMGVACVLVAMGASWGMVGTAQRGKWPANWPKELEPLRGNARTLEVANGTQENIYEIRFSDRASFEKAWPAIMSVKTVGAPLKLSRVSISDKTGLLINDGPMVRIYGPSEGDAVGKDGVLLHAGSPWPKELYGAKGELPEWVMAKEVDGKLTWVELDKADERQGFHNRARVEVELVVDGNVIDLNRVKLPGDGLVIDERF